VVRQPFHAAEQHGRRAPGRSDRVPAFCFGKCRAPDTGSTPRCVLSSETP